MRVVLVFVMLGRLLLSFDQGLQHPPPCPPHLSHLALDVLDLGVNLPDLHFAGAIQLRASAPERRASAATGFGSGETRIGGAPAGACDSLGSGTASDS